MAKKFRRSKSDKLLYGVLGGVSEYFTVDSTIVRVVWLIALGFTGFIPGIMVYVLAVVIVPVEKRTTQKTQTKKSSKKSKK